MSNGTTNGNPGIDRGGKSRLSPGGDRDGASNPRIDRNSTSNERASADRQAAVSLVLAGPHLDLLLIQRAEHPDDPWSGHMALPGGRRDPVDTDLVETARRETREEVGVDLPRRHLWGPLPPIAATARGVATGMTVQGFVFRVPERPATVPNYEVSSILWVPLQHLLSDRHLSHVDYDHAGRKLRLPAWDLDGKLVWGLTHRILTNLLDLARDRDAPFGTIK